VLTEIIMHACGWTDAWYAHPGPGMLRAVDGVRWGGCFYVGVWTGEHCDLLCVRKCKTNPEAERNLSPGSATLLGAALKALAIRLRKVQVAACPRNEKRR